MAIPFPFVLGEIAAHDFAGRGNPTLRVQRHLDELPGSLSPGDDVIALVVQR